MPYTHTRRIPRIKKNIIYFETFIKLLHLIYITKINTQEL